MRKPYEMAFDLSHQGLGLRRRYNRASRAMKQSEAKLGLKVAHQSTNCRLREMEGFGRTGHRASEHNRAECLNLPTLYHASSITFHYGRSSIPYLPRFRTRANIPLSVDRPRKGFGIVRASLMPALCHRIFGQASRGGIR